MATASSALTRGFGRIEDLPSDSSLHWYCPPDGWDDISPDPSKREGKDGSWTVSPDGSTLTLSPPAKKDLWCRTYYRPVLVKDDAPCLFATLPRDVEHTVRATLDLVAARQFDQAGLCARIGPEHWVKAGIEVVDGAPRLSCVVTNVYSDWSTQPWPHSRPAGTDSSMLTASAQLRMHLYPSGGVVVEAREDEDGSEWRFVRIAHLCSPAPVPGDDLPPADRPPRVTSARRGPAAPPDGAIWAGIFGACPEDQGGCRATFSGFSVREGSDFEHDAGGNLE